MSYSFSFFAGDVHEARSKLRDVYAPMSVKAIVEAAINSIKAAPAAPPNQANQVQGRADEKMVGSGVAGQAPSLRAPMQAANPLRGIHVESAGHIDDNGGGFVDISKLIVRPFYG